MYGNTDSYRVWIILAGEWGHWRGRTGDVEVTRRLRKKRDVHLSRVVNVGWSDRGTVKRKLTGFTNRKNFNADGSIGGTVQQTLGKGEN
jgi:hypothetical protein